ncbi:PadR family transcriptional regulator [Gordonia sp. CPCC 205515]|uniref:PadR family transcriptional regulator n=1 Tax=Gordonia sp. CPCC 205515 TaxID=3140791 RepID=UPI003AF40952
MSLRHALLAMLTAEPMTGYDAAKRFEASVGHVWHAPDSQIYPELRKMEKDGLIAGEQVRWGPRSTKTRYSITDDGIGALRDWMNTTLEYQPVRDPVHLQAAYYEWADPECARDHLRRHIDYHQQQVDQWVAMRETILATTHPNIAKRLEKYPAADHEKIVAYKAFTYEGLIDKSRAEIAWARRGLDLVDSLNPDN